MENDSKNEKINPLFVRPDVEAEEGEIKRVGKEFGGDLSGGFVQRFLDASKGAKLTTLDEDMWSKLENTDSYTVAVGDFNTVEDHAVTGQPEAPRDWKNLRLKMERGESLYAPIVLEKEGKLHLVSGNTRLMVARALGKVPGVLLVRME